MDEKTINNYRDLNVWKKAIALTKSIYEATGSFPKAELFGLTSQARRAAVSIPSNIADGFGRAQRKPFVQFLRVAQGSLKELETQALLCGRIGFLSEQEIADLMSRCGRLGKRFVQFIRSLNQAENGE